MSLILNVTSILIIDDSELDRYVAKRLLRKEFPGIELREASSGIQGLEMLRERLPDCLLIDYFLTDTDGIKVLTELNAGRAPDDHSCPTILLTGLDTEAVVAARALQSGAHDYLVKDRLTGPALVRSIGNAVETFRLRHTLRAAEARLRSSFENMPDCFSIYSAQQLDHDHRQESFHCEFMNAAASKAMLGTNADSPLTGDEIVQHCSAEIGHVVASGEPQEKTLTISSPRAAHDELKRTVIVRIWKWEAGFAILWRDITQQRLLEAKLDLAEERLEQAIDAVGAGVYELDCATDQRLYSPQTFRLLGLQIPDGLISTPAERSSRTMAPVTPDQFWERIVPEDRGKIEAVINNARRAEELVEQEGSLAAYIWRYEPDGRQLGKPAQRRRENAI